MKLIEKGKRLMLIMGLLAALLLVFTNIYMISKSAKHIVAVEELDGQEFDYVLVLGCGYYDDETPTPMLDDRVSYGVKAYKASKAEKMLMTGDGQDPEVHDEPKVMSKVAIRQGVEEENVVEDRYGLSTYESMWRAKNVYGAEKIVVVTQKYHLYRAVYLARALGLEAVGVDSTNKIYLMPQIWYDIREVMARCKDFFFGIVKPSIQNAK